MQLLLVHATLVAFLRWKTNATEVACTRAISRAVILLRRESKRYL
jgi:hypothetical protein